MNRREFIHSDKSAYHPSSKRSSGKRSSGSSEGERGASVIGVVFIIAIITFMGLIFVSLLTTGFEVSTREVDSTGALYVAEAGVESAIGHLKQPASYCGGSNCWLWNDGYLDKAAGDGTMDVEVMEHDTRDASALSPVDETFENCTLNTPPPANPARTVLVTLRWDPAVNTNDLGLELYDEASVLVATSQTSNNPEVIRYRMTYSAVCRTYTARVVGNGPLAGPYELRISHPDSSSFNTSRLRAVISEGKVREARREVFSAFRRQ
jgi:Tfp pilus assembly protein PilX